MNSVLQSVCDTMPRSSPPARRPSAGAMPGRCGCCLATDTHRTRISTWAESTYPEALTAEAIVIARGRMVVGDDGQLVEQERAEVVDAAAYAQAVRPVAVA